MTLNGKRAGEIVHPLNRQGLYRAPQFFVQCRPVLEKTPLNIEACGNVREERDAIIACSCFVMEVEGSYIQSPYIWV